MMTAMLLMPMRDGMVVARRAGEVWQAEHSLEGQDCWACAIDPADPATIYAASHTGLFKTTDAGRTWRRIADDLKSQVFWSVAVSAGERGAGGKGVVYAGTEPSMLFRSEDGGQTWEDSPTLLELPSRPTWKYPPKPSTNHLRCIYLDPDQPGVVLLGIEQGGIMRSTDSGRTWRDRQPDAKMDAHTIIGHPGVPGRVYVAAGDGYSESLDHGDTWKSLEDGLPHPYLMSVAVDPADPDTMVTTNSKNWFRAHFPPFPSNTVYRRDKEEGWKEVAEGLPRPFGKMNTGRVATNAAEPHTFYFATGQAEVFRSTDGGRIWQRQEIAWPAGYQGKECHFLAVQELE